MTSNLPLVKVNYSPLEGKKSRSDDMGHYPYFRDLQIFISYPISFLGKIDNIGVLLPYKMHFFC
jgi:hypothetical protein